VPHGAFGGIVARLQLRGRALRAWFGTVLVLLNAGLYLRHLVLRGRESGSREPHRCSDRRSRSSRSRPPGEHVSDLGNVPGRGAGGPPPPVLVGIGMHADCENAALSPPDVRDAIPAHAVEGRALSGP
jgi:hypothetical protein